MSEPQEVKIGNLGPIVALLCAILLQCCHVIDRLERIEKRLPASAEERK